MVYGMKGPSKVTMLELLEKDGQIREAEEIQRESVVLAEQNNIDRSISESNKDFVVNMLDRENSVKAKSKFCGDIKEGFLSECLYKIFNESLSSPISKRNKMLGKTLINSFIKENGATKLITDFKLSNNLLLSEIARLSDKYYTKVLEDADVEGDNVVIDKSVMDDFYKELEYLDSKDVTTAIKDRVADSISEFIDSNTASKIEYEEIIQQAQDKIATIDSSDGVIDNPENDAVKESYISNAVRKVNTLKTTKEKNVFNVMVESLLTKSFTDNSFKDMFIHEGSVDMDSVVESTEVMYTVLEMVNTTNMVHIDEAFIENYLNNL